MDAIQLIQKDHREVERLFSRFDRAARADDEARQQALVRELVRSLSVHAEIEEQFLYPALREAGLEDEVLEALEEHHVAKLMLLELDKMGARDERFAPKVRVLAESVRHHVEEEERELLPRLRRALDVRQLRELGDTLARARSMAPTRPHPAAPDTPPGKFVVAPVAAVYDRTRDVLRGAMAMLRALFVRTAERGAGAARELASDVERRGRGAVEAAGERGRATVADLGERGRAFIQETSERGRETASRAGRSGRRAVTDVQARGKKAVAVAERRGREATRRVQHAGRVAAKRVQQRGRAATRGYDGGTTTVH